MQNPKKEQFSWNYRNSNHYEFLILAPPPECAWNTQSCDTWVRMTHTNKCINYLTLLTLCACMRWKCTLQAFLTLSRLPLLLVLCVLVYHIVSTIFCIVLFVFKNPVLSKLHFFLNITLGRGNAWGVYLVVLRHMYSADSSLMSARKLGWGMTMG